ncbi:MAG: 4'-phosphopantetheinyl transferase family protein [Bacteroidia bacterium]
MPLYYEKDFGRNSQLCIWKITESLEELLEIYEAKNDIFVGEIKTQKRKLEYVAVRILLKKMVKNNELFVELIKDEFGKPHLKDTARHISISHTGQFIAVFLHDAYVVGVDLEMILPRIKKLSSRFLSKAEMKWMKKKNNREQLYIIWGAKECAYKIYSKGGIDFKEMLEVREFDYAKEGATFVTLKKSKISCEYPVFWENLGKLMLVYGIANQVSISQN